MSVPAATVESLPLLVRGRLSAYLALTKPRLAGMVMVTTLAGFYLGGRGGFSLALALNLMVGTALAAGGTLALNQYLERATDSLMERTRLRPLPDGRLSPREALAFGGFLSVGGLLYLWLQVNWLAALVTASIPVVYLLVYTPLKRVSWICNLVGAIPGALPPVVGWAAAEGSLGAPAFVLFAIMYFWQLPHALSIARLYHEDFARANLRLLPDDGPQGNLSNPIVVGACFALIALGVLPRLIGFTGVVSALVGAAAGAAMLVFAVAMVREPARAAPARRLLMASLVYLPLVLVVMILDKA